MAKIEEVDMRTGVVTEKFSVIIPTLQKLECLFPLVEMYCAHNLVNEIIVINNSPTPLQFSHPKVRVLQPSTNIYVNPSWNLGASLAVSPLLIISNDDISFDRRLIDFAAFVLRFPVGILGPHERMINSQRASLPWIAPAYKRSFGFGTLMFMRAANYEPIPPELLIWAGDAWLFYQQTSRNIFLGGIPVRTSMEVTSGQPEFTDQKYLDLETYRARYHDGSYQERFPIGPKLVALLDRVRVLLRQRRSRMS